MENQINGSIFTLDGGLDFGRSVPVHRCFSMMIPFPDFVIYSTAEISPFYAFEQSDGFGKAIVVILFLASILAWTIMLDKWQTVRDLSRKVQAFREDYSHSKLSEFLSRSRRGEGPTAVITESALHTLAGIYQVQVVELQAAIARDGLPPNMNDVEFARLQAVTEAKVDDEIIYLEKRLGLLSSIVSASPFLGLLGTVWGVMYAFTGMAVQGKVDIKAIAPGVSGALLTTVVGLLVAIPAVLGYNLLVSRVKILSVEIDNFATELLSAIRIASMKDGGR